MAVQIEFIEIEDLLPADGTIPQGGIWTLCVLHIHSLLSVPNPGTDVISSFEFLPSRPLHHSNRKINDDQIGGGMGAS